MGRATDDQILEHLPSLRRFALALTREEHPAKDLVQDCLERALKRRHLFEPGTNLRRWLFTIMHNIFIDGRRQAARRGRHQPLNETGIARIEGPAHVFSSELYDLKQAFYRLSKQHQEVMLLVAVEGWSYEEVAKATHVSLGTVKSRLFRARESLRQLLFDEGCESLASARAASPAALMPSNTFNGTHP